MFVKPPALHDSVPVIVVVLSPRVKLFAPKFTLFTTPPVEEKVMVFITLKPSISQLIPVKLLFKKETFKRLPLPSIAKPFVAVVEGFIFTIAPVPVPPVSVTGLVGRTE